MADATTTPILVLAVAHIALSKADISDTGTVTFLDVGRGAAIPARTPVSRAVPGADPAIGKTAGDDPPVLLGVTERLEFVDASGHAADLAR